MPQAAQMGQVGAALDAGGCAATATQFAAPSHKLRTYLDNL